MRVASVNTSMRCRSFALAILLCLDDAKRVAQAFVLDDGCVRHALVLVEDAEGE